MYGGWCARYLRSVGNLSKDYIVNSYPTKILLDKNMRIIGRFATEDELDKKLKELLK